MDVIDADGHIVEKESEIRAYLPEPHCKRSGSLLPSDGQDSLMGGRLGGLEDNDLPTRIRDMDTEGISISVLFPTTSFRVSQTSERDYAIAYCRAYNNFIADVCKTNSRLKAIGFAAVPKCYLRFWSGHRRAQARHRRPRLGGHRRLLPRTQGTPGIADLLVDLRRARAARRAVVRA